MAMELVTGYAGKAHVTSYQDAAIQAGIVGVDNGVLGYVGQGMKAVVTSANNIRIYDGVALIGGKAVVIDRDTYQDVAIANGTVGKYRNDIIYIKYTKNASTGVESVTFDVKQGTAGSSGIDPALSTNSLYSTGTLTSEIPFKRVRLNGLAIESVEDLHDNVPSLTELNRNFSNALGMLTNIKGIYVGSKISACNQTYALLHDNASLTKILGKAPTTNNFVCMVMNGDANAAQTSYYSPRYYSGDGLYVYVYPNVTGNIRVNYVIFAIE
nr:MAG TPA_asm: hypothetical protein [Caudoviricetes sp.]